MTTISGNVLQNLIITICFIKQYRLFNSAVKFRFSLPFINPARSPATLVSVDYSKYVLTSNKLRGNNAVFMTTGHVTECALVNPVSSYEGNSFFGSAPGPLVKRIRLRCLAIEYERLCAYIGSPLHFKGKRGFVGPTSAGGVVFGTKKQGAVQGANGEHINLPSFTVNLNIASFRPLYSKI
jgi:hypothetical protein